MSIYNNKTSIIRRWKEKWAKFHSPYYEMCIREATGEEPDNIEGYDSGEHPEPDLSEGSNEKEENNEIENSLTNEIF